MDSKTKQIVDYLKSEFKAEIIILEGSRASSNYRDNSDWDISIFVNDKDGTSSGWHIFGNELLDLNFVQLPIDNDYILKDMYGPRPYLKVLFDDSQNLGSRIVHDTAIARNEPPKPVSKKNISIRKLGMEKNIEKIQDSIKDPAAAFYSIGNFYDRALRWWFNFRCEWPLHPKEALPYIKEKDPEFYLLITELVTTSNWQKKPIICQKICAHLFND